MSPGPALDIIVAKHVMGVFDVSPENFPTPDEIPKYSTELESAKKVAEKMGWILSTEMVGSDEDMAHAICLMAIEASIS